VKPCLNWSNRDNFWPRWKVPLRTQNRKQKYFSTERYSSGNSTWRRAITNKFKRKKVKVLSVLRIRRLLWYDWYNLGPLGGDLFAPNRNQSIKRSILHLFNQLQWRHSSWPTVVRIKSSIMIYGSLHTECNVWQRGRVIPPKVKVVPPPPLRTCSPHLLRHVVPNHVTAC